MRQTTRLGHGLCRSPSFGPCRASKSRARSRPGAPAMVDLYPRCIPDEPDKPGMPGPTYCRNATVYRVSCFRGTDPHAPHAPEDLRPLSCECREAPHRPHADIGSFARNARRETLSVSAEGWLMAESHRPRPRRSADTLSHESRSIRLRISSRTIDCFTSKRADPATMQTSPAQATGSGLGWRVVPVQITSVPLCLELETTA